jgi:hypothetical protein
LAAAKAGISGRSARRIDGSATLPSQSPRRYWRSRADPFARVWESEVLPLLRGAPKLMAVTLLRKLQDDHPAEFPDGVLRTLQRHVRQWRALEGPPQEVFFPQDYAPGHRGLSDFTAMGELRITIAEAPFAHLLYHFVLAFSRWENAEVVDGVKIRPPDAHTTTARRSTTPVIGTVKNRGVYAIAGSVTTM